MPRTQIDEDAMEVPKEHWLQRQVRQSTDRLAGYEKGEAAIRKAVWLEAAEMAEAEAAKSADVAALTTDAGVLAVFSARAAAFNHLAAAYREKAASAADNV